MEDMGKKENIINTFIFGEKGLKIAPKTLFESGFSHNVGERREGMEESDDEGASFVSFLKVVINREKSLRGKHSYYNRSKESVREVLEDWRRKREFPFFEKIYKREIGAIVN